MIYYKSFGSSMVCKNHRPQTFLRCSTTLFFNSKCQSPRLIFICIENNEQGNPKLVNVSLKFTCLHQNTLVGNFCVGISSSLQLIRTAARLISFLFRSEELPFLRYSHMLANFVAMMCFMLNYLSSSFRSIGIESASKDTIHQKSTILGDPFKTIVINFSQGKQLMRLWRYCGPEMVLLWSHISYLKVVNRIVVQKNKNILQKLSL